MNACKIHSKLHFLLELSVMECSKEKNVQLFMLISNVYVICSSEEYFLSW